MKNFKRNLLANGIIALAIFLTSFAKAQCNASFSYTVGANGNVQFASTSTGTNSTTSYFWSFGDNNWGYGSSIGHNYNANGGYYVTLMINDSINSCYDSTSVFLNITNVTNPAPCNLNASFSYTLGANGIVQFASTSTGVNPGANYYWYFGDSNTGNGVNTSNQYASSGSYFVTLYISDSLTSCFDSTSALINITSAPCLASVSYGLYQDSTQALTWDVYPNYSSNVSGATWYWGDGNSTNGLYPSHTYSAAGMYSICVTVTASCGGTASACSSYNIYKTVNSNRVSAAITVNVKNQSPTGIKSNTSSFNDLSIYPNPARENITINISSEANQLLSVNVFNTNGSLVLKQQETLQNGTNKIVLNTNDLAPGIYLINLNSGNKHQTMKMVKQ